MPDKFSRENYST